MAKPDREKLRTEYHEMRRDGRDNLLKWCTAKARKCGMTYGQFVNWLGI